MKATIVALVFLGFAAAETKHEVDLLKKMKLKAGATIPSGNIID